MPDEPINEEYEAGRTVGYAEGYLDGRAEPAPVPAGYWPLNSPSANVWACTCGVISGGARDPRKGCPMHDAGAGRG